ncbi:MAG: hypothetical protein IJL26_07830, partial [Clostridia bacterium]|nr:hypothetical protein [Clostridia bacterium]
PDLVLFGYFYNDPDVGLEGTGAVTNATLNASFVPDGKNDGIIRAVSNLLPNIGERLANYVTARSMYSTESSFVPIFGVPPVLKGQVLENYRRDFIEPLDEYAAGADFPVAIVTLPLYRGRIVQQALFRPLRELCAGAEHIRLYDSLHDLYARFAAPKHADNYVINIADGHPGSAIQYFYAQYIERFLKKDYADVLGDPCGEDLNAPLPTVNEALPGRTAPKLTERTDDESVWRFYYPSETRDYSFADFSFPRYHLTLPLEKSFVALSFAEPVDLARIELSGEGLEDAEIYYRCVNETLGYDDHTVRPFGTKDGGVRTDDAQDRVTTLMIHAKCRNDDGAVLTMKLTTAGHGG